VAKSKKSRFYHCLTTIRGICKLNQDDMAKILGVAKITIARIESGSLKLSEKLANKIQEEFDVSAAWLLANDDLAPILTERDTIWGSDHFEFTQGWRSDLLEQERDGTTSITYRSDRAGIKGSEDDFVRWKMAEYMAQIHAMLDATRGQPRRGILIHRLNKMVSELRKDFKVSSTTLDSYRPQISQLRKRYMETLKDKSKAEEKALWSKEPTPLQRIPNQAWPSSGESTST
jgi:DNA-binding XRE family transcriptional regulator